MGLVWLLFSFNGRIGRAQYLLGLAIVLVGLFLGPAPSEQPCTAPAWMHLA
jgi:uncharacterized membrane protein YhaH (DUF805 family)